MDTIWLWVGFNIFVLALLALDLGVLHKEQKQITVRHALLLSLGYIVLALIFAAGLFIFMGNTVGYQFLTGYLIEKSLSADNIFVFVLIFSHFAVPPQYQYRVLFWGILGALVLRATLILVGAAVIEAFHWVIYLFGTFLIVTGIKMLVTVGQEPDIENNRIVTFMRRNFRVTDSFSDDRFFVVQNGVRYMTPLFIVLVLVELTDVVFALDSIPAIFLYFALAGIIHRFHYLKYGLSLVLVVVGTKMLLNAWFGTKVVPTEIALLITASLIAGSIAFSIWKTRSMPAEEATEAANRWWVPGSPAKKESGRNKYSAPGPK